MFKAAAGGRRLKLLSEAWRLLVSMDSGEAEQSASKRLAVEIVRQKVEMLVAVVQQEVVALAESGHAPTVCEEYPHCPTVKARLLLD